MNFSILKRLRIWIHPDTNTMPIGVHNCTPIVLARSIVLLIRIFLRSI